MDTDRIAWSARGFLIYLLALPLVPALLATIERAELTKIGLASIAVTAFVVAAVTVRFGTRRQRRQAFSRYAQTRTNWLTWIGCAAIAAGIFVSQFFLARNGFVMAGTLALTGFVGGFLSYGTMWKKILPVAGDGYTAAEIVEELRGAETRVQAIEAVARKLPASEIRRRLKRVTSKTWRVLRAIENDPADLRRARKFLNVFLPGIQGVAQSYLKTNRDESVEDFDARFHNLLVKTEKIVDEQHGKVRDKHIFDLDVQMDVLRTQLDAEVR